MGIPPPPVVMTAQPMGGHVNAGPNAPLGNYSYNASVPAPVPAPHQSSFPSFTTSQQLPTLSTGYPPAASSNTSNLQVPTFAPPPHTYNNLQANRAAPSTGSGRIIQPGAMIYV